jgi:predicted alpha-1,2-mannosidase
MHSLNLLSRLLAVCFILIIAIQSNAQRNHAQYVNPFIGTGGHGHTYPGATTPFGMVQLSPDTRIDGSWDGCSGYHYSDSVLYGFSHTHLSGTGVSDYGDVMLMPTVGTPKYLSGEYASTFNHKNENASAGYYSVKIDNGVAAEFTTTPRVGLHRYLFPTSNSSNLLLDMTHRDECTEALIEIVSPTKVRGYRRSKAWATNQYIAFVIEFSQPVVSYSVWDKGDIKTTGNKFSNTDARINFQFATDGTTPVLVKVALSPVSPEGAERNMAAELPHWDFNKVRANAEATWNKELSKIEITTNQQDQLTIFYTALYHCFTNPNTATDVDGQYRGMDQQIHKAEGYTHYSVFSLWDTFRALHPLYTLLDRKRTNDFIQSFLSMYKQGGRLPVWELASNETDCMIGYHSVSVITDAAIKGIDDFDKELMLEAMVKSATWNHLGLPAYQRYGVITIDDDHESVSKTLEYAYDDWCISQFAGLVGNMDMVETFTKRSLFYRNAFDPSTGFMRPKKNGGWLAPFAPNEVNNHFTEANSWQYSFFVPHDLKGHIQLLGGSDAYEQKLDELFSTSTETSGREQVDITGLIGQYAHGNEPSHHMAYLYNYVGKSHKTQAMVRKILKELYHAAPDGLSGNEDCGQMSAWYVLSSLGIYQVCPGKPEFVIGSPLFEKSVLRFENGRQLQITANKNSDQNIYIKSASVNNTTLSNLSITYDDLLGGGEMLFEMADVPATDIFEPVTPTRVEGKPFVVSPAIEGGNKSFKTSATVTLTGCRGCKTYYTLDESEPDRNSILYDGNFHLFKTTTVKAINIDASGNNSYSSAGTFYRVPNDWGITINATYLPMYSAGGDGALLDGIRGNENWRKGDWQGFPQRDFEAIIDLKKPMNVSEVGGGFLQDTRAWIVFPTKVSFEFSMDGKTWKPLATINNTIEATDYNIQTKDFIASTKKQKARFIKVIAHNFGKLPEWHQGYPFDGYAYVFVDEIWVK